MDECTFSTEETGNAKHMKTRITQTPHHKELVTLDVILHTNALAPALWQNNLTLISTHISMFTCPHPRRHSQIQNFMFRVNKMRLRTLPEKFWTTLSLVPPLPGFSHCSFTEYK